MMAVIFVQRFVIKVSDGIVNFCQDEIKAILANKEALQDLDSIKQRFFDESSKNFAYMNQLFNVINNQVILINAKC